MIAPMPKPEINCCTECDRGTWCGWPDCPCHEGEKKCNEHRNGRGCALCTATPNTKDEWKKCDCYAYDGSKRDCDPECDCQCHMSSTPPKMEEWNNEHLNINDWNKDFDKEFNSASDFCSCYEGDMHDLFPDAIKSLKSFIQNLVTKTRLSTIEEAKGMLEGMEKDYIWDNGECSICGFSSLGRTCRFLGDEAHHCASFNESLSQMLENLNKLKEIK